MKAAIVAFGADAIAAHRESIRHEKSIRDLAKRLRWDLLYIAIGSRWICDNLYSYMNDDHIDTALRAIMAEIQA